MASPTRRPTSAARSRPRLGNPRPRQVIAHIFLIVASALVPTPFNSSAPPRNEKQGWAFATHAPLHDMLAFQFPPHHRRTRSPPHSSYSALLTPTRFSSSVCANAAIPRHASIDGSAARTMRSGISGGRIGRSVACSRSARPGICAGEPVRKTFCVVEETA